ncbi:hypothetical protein A1O1_05922 [Capronia coronata CBS 617.96]|uniref:Uncharacterized protein n=1 Tax=Capronia coronata CBS 617.96 TaxID=1182541 RepID=W9XZA1_9EURO|nr:uncharacterized protein A1O1_05922 [Capronia coronata CBS 617.96]EXJ85558.1 hypothetical protein A1O1_05922 [Capronia coronata CBS 617.96]
MTMASRIMYLLKHKHTVSCIPCHFKEEFNREIDEDTVLAILEQQFDITEDLIPNGEILIPTRRPAIDATGYVKGHVLPAGIYWEIINSRRHPPHLIEILVKERWGFTVHRDTIAKAINDWQVELTLSGRPAPDDARPRHDGRLLSELAVSASPAMHNRASFSNDPPPVYEPRPVIQGTTLRHPREVNPIGSHHYPYFPRGQEPPAPAYTEGGSPPSYGGFNDTSGRNRPETSSTRVSRTSATNVAEDVDRTMVPTGIHGSTRPPAVDTKFQKGSEQSFPTFSRSNVIDYLFRSVCGIALFPHGPHEPVAVGYTGDDMMKRYMQLTAVIRRRQLRPEDLFPDNVVNAQGDLDEPGRVLANFIRPIFAELQMSACPSSRKVMLDFAMQPNVGGLYFMLNHMRERRGVEEVAYAMPDMLARAVIDELRLSDNAYVMLVLSNYAPNFMFNCLSLQVLLREILDRRNAHPKVRLQFAFHPASGIPQLTDPSQNGRAAPGPVEDGEPALTALQLMEYQEGLKFSKVLLCATLESMKEEGFLMRRSLLEEYIREAMRTAQEGTEACLQLRHALTRIGDMRRGTTGPNYPSDWWAAVLTNASLAIVGRSTTSHLWMTIPAIAPPATTGPTMSEEDERTDQGVRVPEDAVPITTLIPYEREIPLEQHEHNLHRLHTWNAEIRRWPTDLAFIADVLLPGLRRDRRQIVLQLHGRRMVHASRQEYDALMTLLAQFRQEFTILRDSLRRLIDPAVPVDRQAQSLLQQEIARYDSALMEYARVYVQCHESPFASVLDFTATMAAVRQLYWELSRVRFWSTRHHQAPLDGHDLVELAASAEAAVTRLQSERLRLEMNAAHSVHSNGEDDQEDPDAGLPPSGQGPDEQSPMDHEGSEDAPSDTSIGVANDEQGHVSSDVNSNDHQEQQHQQQPEQEIEAYPTANARLPAPNAEQTRPPSRPLLIDRHQGHDQVADPTTALHGRTRPAIHGSTPLRTAVPRSPHPPPMPAPARRHPFGTWFASYFRCAFARERHHGREDNVPGSTPRQTSQTYHDHES